jgi:hypothetical protein
MENKKGPHISYTSQYKLKRPPFYNEQKFKTQSSGPITQDLNRIVPTTFYQKIPNPSDELLSDASPTNKKVRVKLICVFPKWRYLCANTTVQDYHSLFGGVVDNINNKNHFASILCSLEKEFNEETSGSIHLNFQKRKFTFRDMDLNMQELSFVYIGTFHEFDTIFTVIYIPKITNEIILNWNLEIKKSQENLLRTIFKGWNLNLDQIFMINRIYHQKSMKIQAPHYSISKPMFNLICSKLKEYHVFLEKTGVTIMNEEEFFDQVSVWEWNTMESDNVRIKIHDLFMKTGVQVQE